MNRTDRLLALVFELQRKGKRRAEDLAAHFEITKRTVYRDVQALCEAGVPIVSLPGQGYALMEGYFLPPLSFSTDEATMLLLGSDFVAQHFDSQYRTAAKSAARKIETVLSTKLRAEVSEMQNSIALVPMTGSERENDALKKLRRAVIERKTTRIEYQSVYAKEKKDARTTREVDPYGLVHYTGNWYVVAYCHLRQDMRFFRLDRIVALTILDCTFIRPANFSMEQLDEDDRRVVTIRVVFDRELADAVREWRSYYVDEMQETATGLLVTLRVHYENEVLHWLLGWGAGVRILEPESLRQRFVQEAKKMLANYKSSQKILT
jgi:predicted DNA-binding transcriptional regulator YafY